MIAFLTLFLTSMIVAFSGAMMPGPLLTVTINESTRVGAKAGPVLIAGHAILEAILIVALLMGLGPFLKNEVFFMVIALLGGSIMLWMAWGMLRSLPSLSIKGAGITQKKNNLMLAGALMSLANPYWIIWWATIGLTYIVQSEVYGYWGILFFFTGHILGDLIWYSAISYTVAKGRRLFTDKVYRLLVGICGAFLFGFAVYLFVAFFQKLR